MEIARVTSLITADSAQSQDWVTLGILLHKTQTKKTKTNNNFICFTFGDLQGTEVKFFLFNSAYEEWWKTTAGTVLGILNAECLPSSAAGATPAYKIDSAGKILKIGEAADFGVCIGISENKKCQNYVDM